MMTSSIYLASQSPRRRELLDQIGVGYEVINVDVDETRKPNEAPASYVQRLSQAKAQAGAALCNDLPVLGADTIVVLGDSDVLGKPRDEEEAFGMLLCLSGSLHTVMTSVSVVHQGQCHTRVNFSFVNFRDLTEQEIRAYCRTGEPLDKAGAYGLQGMGAIFIDSITGSYSSIVGLPILETSELLAYCGVDILSAPIAVS